jgi:hypothetical protein
MTGTHLARRLLPVGITIAASLALAAGLALNTYLLIAAGVVGLTAAAWVATEDP